MQRPHLCSFNLEIYDIAIHVTSDDEFQGWIQVVFVGKCRWADDGSRYSIEVIFLSIKKEVKVLVRINYQFLCSLAALCFLPGCGLISPQSIYEGVRGHDKTKTTGTTQTPSVLPTYDQYEKERQVLKE